MTPLPPPPNTGQKPPTGGPRRKSSLRTAAGTVQDQFLSRLRELREDPTLCLPDCIGREPGALARLRRGLERLKAGKVPLAARFDRHVLGAAAKAIKLAEWDAAPRLLDAKIAGQRRFYLQRGHVNRMCSLGVQNHDEARVLMVAYGTMAKRHGLHFFAGKRLWCTGKIPQPPQEWIDGLGETGGVSFLGSVEPGWACRHDDRARVRLQWRDGPWLQACGECGRRAGGLHQRVRQGYLGPVNRQPVEVDVRLPDGFVHVPEREQMARYRAGLVGETELAAAAMAAWREAGADRWVLGDRAFASRDAFLAALAPEEWERPVLAALVANGCVAEQATVASVFEARRDGLGAALVSLLHDGPAFAAARQGLPLRDLVRAAHDESRRRQTIAQLPRLVRLGPQGVWIDGLARTLLGDGRAAAIAQIGRSMDAPPVPRTTLYAFIRALGGALNLEIHFTVDEKGAAKPLADLSAQVLQSRGEAYALALAEFLRVTGSGEEAHLAGGAGTNPPRA